jgi:hypothetical protein
MTRYLDIIEGLPFTVRMPWIALADAVAVYQSGSLADPHACFGPDWFDEDGRWPDCHEWTLSFGVPLPLGAAALWCEP